MTHVTVSYSSKLQESLCALNVKEVVVLCIKGNPGT